MGHLCTLQVVECSISCPQNKWSSSSDASRDSALLLSRNWEFLKKTKYVHHGCFSHQHLKVSSSSSSSSLKSIIFCSNSESKPQQSRYHFSDSHMSSGIYIFGNNSGVHPLIFLQTPPKLSLIACKRPRKEIKKASVNHIVKKKRIIALMSFHN